MAKRAEDFLETVNKRELVKIIQVIDDLAKDPRPRWVEKLKGIKSGEYYRTSWGKYRIIYSIDDNLLYVYIADVNGRDDSYKKMNKRFK